MKDNSEKRIGTISNAAIAAAEADGITDETVMSDRARERVIQECGEFPFLWGKNIMLDVFVTGGPGKWSLNYKMQDAPAS